MTASFVTPTAILFQSHAKLPKDLCFSMRYPCNMDEKMQSDEELALDESMQESDLSDGTSVSEMEVDCSDWSWASREESDSSDVSLVHKDRPGHFDPNKPGTR